MLKLFVPEGRSLGHALTSSPASLIPASPATPFHSLSSSIRALFVFGDSEVRNDADTWRQSLFLAFFLAVLDFDIHIVGVPPLLLKGASLLPESALVGARSAAHPGQQRRRDGVT
jgi:hypothetical protein